MVHADASDFPPGLSKQEAYEQVLEAAAALCKDQRNWVCNLANAASLLYHAYKALPLPSSQVNWAEFYVVDPKDPAQLILGPFQGKVACQTIRFSRGVCGTAATSKETIIVSDVEAFPGHIACDGDSKSEIMVPVTVDNKLVAIIDIDSAGLSGFDEVDANALESLSALLARSCDW